MARRLVYVHLLLDMIPGRNPSYRMNLNIIFVPAAKSPGRVSEWVVQVLLTAPAATLLTKSYHPVHDPVQLSPAGYK